MPGPFPGMDPWLESPRFWRSVHHELISYISQRLNQTLPSEYAALIDERVYVETPEKHHYYPDVAVTRTDTPQMRAGTTALLKVPAASPSITIEDYPRITEAFIEIRTVDSARRLITVIEVLSPANKQTYSSGRSEYLKKQRETLYSSASLLEIDLLRGGAHTVAAPRTLVRKKAKYDYLISLHRAFDPNRYELWPCAVTERLPVVRVPLAQGDPEITLDLQAIPDHVYDTGPYLRLVNYDQPPVPVLRSAIQKWAEVLLQGSNRQNRGRE